MMHRGLKRVRKSSVCLGKGVCCKMNLNSKLPPLSKGRWLSESETGGDVVENYEVGKFFIQSPQSFAFGKIRLHVLRGAFHIVKSQFFNLLTYFWNII